jgi:hypothetical protein
LKSLSIEIMLAHGDNSMTGTACNAEATDNNTALTINSLRYSASVVVVSLHSCGGAEWIPALAINQ